MQRNHDFSGQRTAFRQLHKTGCFVMPNPWDMGSTRALRQLGFQAVATTSAGLGFSRGLPDVAGTLLRDDVLTHIREIVLAADDLPVNADFQNGYAATAEGVAESIRLCIATGVSGLSIEDATGEAANPLYELPEALDRLRAARAAINEAGQSVLLTGRAECYLVGHPDPLRESIRRLQAYSEAGADVLYAPGIRDREEIRTIVSAVAPKPVNILMSANTGVTVADLAAMGVRRVSLGSALARAAWGAFLRAAEQIAETGSFAGLEGAIPFAKLNSMF